MNQDLLTSASARGRWKVRDTALILRRFFFCERSLILTQSAWLAGIAPVEIKIGIPKFVWQQAQTAGSLRERVFELRFPSRLMEVDDDIPLLAIFDAARHAPSAGALLGALHQVFLPALIGAYETFLDISDEIGDGPTRRFLAHSLADKKAQATMYAQYAAQLRSPAEAAEGDAWIGELRSALNALGGVSVEDHPYAASSEPFKPAHAKPWSFAQVPSRDQRFLQNRFYWPDIVDPEFGYGEGLRLQLRSAVSHVNEVWAVETAGAILNAFAELLGFDFVADAARWCYDESRHCRMGYQRLLDWGFVPGEIPLGTYIFDSAFNQDPIYRLGMLFFFETKNIGKKPRRVAAFREIHDDVSEHDMDFDWADEAIHAAYGKKWLTEVLKLRGDASPESFNAVQDHCSALVASVVQSATSEEKTRIAQIAQAMIDKASAKAGMMPG